MKKNLEIEEVRAKELFKTASPEMKQIFIDTFGHETFIENIMDQVKTFEDALKIVGCISNETLMIIKYNGTDKYMLFAKAAIKLEIIAQALNGGWTPNWSDTTEQKWYPYFDVQSGFTFVNSYYNFWFVYAYGGSCLCFKSEALSSYAGQQFVDLYKEFLMID